MLGQIILDAHRGFQRFGRTISDWWAAAESHPAYQAVRSRREYARMQAHFRRLEQKAVRGHGRVNDVRKQRAEALHNALAGGRR